MPAENASRAVTDAMVSATARTGATRWTAPPARKVGSSVLPADAASGTLLTNPDLEKPWILKL